MNLTVGGTEKKIPMQAMVSFILKNINKNIELHMLLACMHMLQRYE